ncbi:MAG TPA: DMT family transporter [Nostocaceae cyanobacterium]|nr:DMT family transporter [Nostocaceae cyanobacterium]
MSENIELEQHKYNFPEKFIPLISLLVGISAISTTALFIKVSVQEMSVNSTMFNRLWIASIIFISLNVYHRFRPQDNQKPIQETFQKPSYQIIDFVLLIIVSLIYISGRFLWTISLYETTVANAMILNSSTPLFTALGGWLFLRQSFGVKFIIGLVVAIVGSITLELGELQKVNINLIGDGAALLSSVFFAANLLIVEKIRNKFSSSQILLSRCLVGTASVLPIVLLFEDNILPTTTLGWITVICMAAIGEMIGHGLLVYSVKFFPSSFVAITMLLEPIIAIILAWIIFSEGLGTLTWLALALVLLGVYLSKDDVERSSDEVPSTPVSSTTE